MVVDCSRDRCKDRACRVRLLEVKKKTRTASAPAPIIKMTEKRTMALIGAEIVDIGMEVTTDQRILLDQLEEREALSASNRVNG